MTCRIFIGYLKEVHIGTAYCTLSEITSC